jgi:glycosyltransferase involved in cell wall biosynthesis
MRDRNSLLEKPTSGSSRPGLWVVSEVYYPEETSTGYYMTAIAEGLAGKFDVKVLCGQPNYSQRGTRAPSREIHNETEIFRAAGTTLDKNVVIFRLVNMMTLGLSVLWKGLRRFRRGDRILVVTTPPLMPFIVAIASLTKGASYTLLIHDSFPESAIAVGILDGGGVAAKVIDMLNRWLYKNAARLIVVGRDMKELVERKTTGLRPNVSIIPNWAEIDDVRPTPRSENHLLKELGISDKLVILHAGNIGRPTDVETLIEALTLMKGDKRFHFVFIGSGAKGPLLESAIKQNGLDMITMLPPRPRSQQLEFLNACDVGLVSLVKNMWGAAMPSKTYNIMAAGKPILALTDDGTELAKVIEEERIGWHIPSGDPDRLVRVLNDVYNSRDTLAEMGNRSRAAAEQKYSVQNAIDHYSEVLG